MRPNPAIVGRVSDETGCVAGSNLIWSEQAWLSLLGRSAQGFSESCKEDLQFLDDFYMFARVDIAFGWDSEIGKIAIRDVAALVC